MLSKLLPDPPPAPGTDAKHPVPRCAERGSGLSALLPVVTALMESSKKYRSIKSECKRTLDILLFRGPYKGGLGVDSGILKELIEILLLMRTKALRA